MGFKVKQEFFYNAWKAMQDWITGVSADKPKVDVTGTVQVSATDPLPVSINNSLATIKSAPVTGAKTITDTAAEVFAGASRLAGRYQMTIQNVDTLIVYIGGAGVNTAGGFPLLPGDSITLSFKPDVATPIYAIADGSNAVRVVELA